MPNNSQKGEGNHGTVKVQFGIKQPLQVIDCNPFTFNYIAKSPQSLRVFGQKHQRSLSHLYRVHISGSIGVFSHGRHLLYLVDQLDQALDHVWP